MLNLQTVTQTLGKNIRYIRRCRKLTQSKFADQIKVSRAALGSYEELRALPNILVMIKLSEISGHGIKTLVTTDISKIKEGAEDEA